MLRPLHPLFRRAKNLLYVTDSFININGPSGVFRL